jgi:transcription initiation factor IIF auxiliary subunit
LTEEGYGSFDMRVVIYFTDPAVPPHSFVHPLRLDKEKSEDYHTLKFKDVSDDFYRALIGGADARKKQPSQLIVDDEQEQELLYGYDVDVLANKLHSLAGDKVLKVVELLKKYRTKTTYMEEDNGEFHFDLYTLSPDAVAALWLAVSDD